MPFQQALNQLLQNVKDVAKIGRVLDHLAISLPMSNPQQVPWIFLKQKINNFVFTYSLHAPRVNRPTWVLTNESCVMWIVFPQTIGHSTQM